MSTPDPRPERPCVALGPRTDHVVAALVVASEHAGVDVAAERVALRVRSAADPDAELQRALAEIERDASRAA